MVPVENQLRSECMLIVTMGVSGTGKSTLGRAIAEATHVPFIDGDDLHPRENIDKMSSGQELTETDREPWLELIRTTAERMLVEQHLGGVVVACSALKKYYRDILRGTAATRTRPHVGPMGLGSPQFATFFVYIKEDKDILRDRIQRREGHFMKVNMLESQMNTLESPEGEQGVVTIRLDASTEEQVGAAKHGLAELARQGPFLRTPASGR